MTLTEILTFFNTYGIAIIFLIVFLEYINLPGFPAGIILPAAGIWAQNEEHNFFLILLVSLVAGLFGSSVLYFIGKIGGQLFLEKYLKKFPKQRPIFEKYTFKLTKYSNKTLFISKLIPVARTIIGIPAGVIKMNIFNYLLYSGLGILIWNSVFILSGYLFSDLIINYLT